MSDGRQQFFLSTASAPVSRQHSAQESMQDSNIEHNEPSPPSSGRTAVHDFERASSGAAAPPLRVRAERAARLGSASAPASPGEIEGDVPGHAGGAAGGALTGFPLDAAAPGAHLQHPAPQDNMALPMHPDPAVQAGLLHPADSEAIMPVPESLTRSNTIETAGGGSVVGADGIRRRDHHRHHHHHRGHSGRTTPGSSYYPDYYARPLNHQNSRHTTPVFSLARPLPTKEQRDAQKAYREHIRARAAGGAGVGPGAKHHAAAGVSHSAGHSRAPTPLLGPGAHHYPSPYGAGMFPYGGQPMHRQDTADRNEIKDMLRQLLADQQKGNDNADDEAGKEKNKKKGKDVREDSALARKEGFGEEKGGRPTAAQRRGSASSGSSSSSGSSGSSSDSDDVEAFPNPWARFRHSIREPLAEFLGTFLLILFGTGVSLQYFLSLDEGVAPNPRGTYLSVSFGWGVGVAMGVWVAGGISGGHLNPAVTISLAVYRGFPWRKVPGYILAQIIGSMTAAGTTYGLYRGAINIFEGGENIRTVSGPNATAALFSTYPLEYMTDAACFFNEFVDSAVLLMVVLAISDSNNAAPPDGLNPLVLFLLILGIGACLGMQTAYCINPARDLGPRLVTWMAGYSREVWNFRNQYWLWTPVIATISGALFGSFLYDALIYTGSESPLNKKWEFPWDRKKRASFGPSSKDKAPAGLGPDGSEEQYA